MRKISLNLPDGLSEDNLRAFLRLYEFESWLRELIYLELKTYYGTAWWTEVENAFRRRGGINFDRSFRSDKRHPHMVTPETDPLWFISFETLLRILFAPKFWGRFKTYLTTKMLLRAKFTEITAVRNRVAHCRPLHRLDTSRIDSLMTDLDQGFWNFCTSYNLKYFVGEHDPLHEWVERNRPLTSLSIELFASVRPSTPRKKAQKPGPGWFYHIRFIQPNLGRYLDYPAILRWTRRHHQHVLHIILDSFQHGLVVTVPTVTPLGSLTALTDSFIRACGNCYSISPLVPVAMPLENPWEEHWKRMKPFEIIVAEWPHYVLSPAHPFGFLDPDCSCTFFQAAAES